MPDRGTPLRRDAGIGLVGAPLEFSSAGRRGRRTGCPLPSSLGPLPQLGPAPRGGNPRPVSGPAACVHASSARAVPRRRCDLQRGGRPSYSGRRMSRPHAVPASPVLHARSHATDPGRGDRGQAHFMCAGTSRDVEAAREIQHEHARPDDVRGTSHPHARRNVIHTSREPSRPVLPFRDWRARPGSATVKW